jgi:Cu/Ag efflux protein CusF
LHTDKTTQMMGQLKKGDRIEAKVTDQNHALVIRQVE